MKLLKNVEIHNYRILKNIDFPANSINIIVGPNNTGKSSILEAIAFLLTSPNYFKDILIKEDLLTEDAKNIVDYLVRYREYYPKYFVRINSNKSIIKGIFRKNSSSIKIEYFEKGVPKDERGEEIVRFIESQFRDEKLSALIQNNIVFKIIFKFLSSQEEKNLSANSMEDYLKKRIKEHQAEIAFNLINQPKIILEFKREPTGAYRRYVYFPRRELVPENMDSSEIELNSILSVFWNVMHLISKKGRVSDWRVVFMTNKILYPYYTINIYDSLVKSGSMEKIKDFIMNHIPYIKSIDRTKDDLYIQIVGYNKPLPLSSMGDGFITLLRLSFMVGLARKGVILWEEPEMSLHPKFLEIIGEEIVSNSNETQFFISTHSMDLLNYILKKAEEKNKLSQINIIRLHYREDLKEVYAEVISGKEAKDEIDEIEIDLRYT